MKEIIATERAPRAIGPYSQAVRAGNLLFAWARFQSIRRPENLSQVASLSKRTRSFAICRRYLKPQGSVWIR